MDDLLILFRRTVPPPPEAVLLREMVHGYDAPGQYGAVFHVLHQQVVDVGASSGSGTRRARINAKTEAEGHTMSILKTATGYQVRWYDADGVSRKDRREAERLEREKLAERDRGELPTDERHAPTFKSFAEDVWKAEGRPRWKPSTIAQYTDALKHLTAAFGELRVSQVTEAKVSPWIAGLQGKRLSARRINLLLVTLKSILKLARRRRFVREDLLADVRLLKEPKADIDPLGPEEVSAFLAACPSWWRPYFTTALFTGFRPNEAAALRWGDVDGPRASFRIRAGLYRWQEGTPKTESSIRDVDMLPMVVDALKAQKAQQAAQRLKMGKGAPEVGADYVFTGPDGGRFNINFVRDRVWYKTLTAGKLRRRTMYQTRHSFASNALAAGENPAWVAAMLGHKGAEILFDVYARYIPNKTRRDGSAFAARMDGESQKAVIQGRQTAEQNA
jgi:integrase